MPKDYLVVSRKVLPEYLDKVLYARSLLEDHEVTTITEAVHRAGISRNTYYKYRDCVYDTSMQKISRHAVISLLIKDESGSLASVMQVLRDLGTSILTISQAIPISGKANVLLSLDVSEMICTSDELTLSLRSLSQVRRVHIDAIE